MPGPHCDTCGCMRGLREAGEMSGQERRQCMLRKRLREVEEKRRQYINEEVEKKERLRGY